MKLWILPIGYDLVNCPESKTRVTVHHTCVHHGSVCCDYFVGEKYDKKHGDRINIECSYPKKLKEGDNIYY